MKQEQFTALHFTEAANIIADIQSAGNCIKYAYDTDRAAKCCIRPNTRHKLACMSAPADAASLRDPTDHGFSWYSPMMVGLLAAGFLAALFTGWSITSRLAKPDLKQSSEALLRGGGALPLLHAMLQMQQTGANDVVGVQSKIIEDSQRLEKMTHLLTDLQKQIDDENIKIVNLGKLGLDTETRKSFALARMKLLDQMKVAYEGVKSAKDDFIKTQDRMAKTSGGTNLTHTSADVWKKEWQDKIADVTTKIDQAKMAFDELKAIDRAKWEVEKESFAERAEAETKLKAAEVAIKEAETAFPKAKEVLNAEMQKRLSEVRAEIQKTELTINAP